ncbi:MAG: Rha family transcriptional regulator [Pseudomonadota bacterium]
MNHFSVQTEDGIPKTTSLEVARIFGKSHYSVLRAIRNRDIPEEFSGHNFEFLEIIDKTKSGMLLNKSYFKMTRVGFNLIAMGVQSELMTASPSHMHEVLTLGIWERR